MKKLCFAFFFLAPVIGLGFIPTAAAQQSIFSLQFGGPATTVSVLNDTADNTPLRVEIGGKEDRQLITRGGSWGRSFGVGTNANMSVVIFACMATAEGGPIVQPPIWATDVAIAGGNALTTQYLATNPTEGGLKRRVGAIKRAIHDRLGHKEMQDALDDWFKVVKHTGLRPVGILCQGPFIIVQNVSVQQYGWQSQAITLVVRGDRENGYRAQLVR